MNKQEYESLIEHIQLEYLEVIILELVEVECPRCLMLEKTKVLTRLSCEYTENEYIPTEITGWVWVLLLVRGRSGTHNTSP